MILVMLGTQNNSFHRLLEEVEKNIENGTIQEDVIVQAGYTKFESKHMQIFDLIPKEKLEELQEKANISSIEKDKKVIAVPRLHEFGEHVNNHQKEIVKDFNDKGYIIGIENVEQLKDAILKAKEFKPVKYKHNNEKMLKIIQEFIDK